MVASYVGYKIVLHIYAETYTQHISLQGSVRKFHHSYLGSAILSEAFLTLLWAYKASFKPFS